MTYIRINGSNRPLKGSIRISGAKNAALKLICSSLLCDKRLSLSNVPALADVETLVALLRGMGVAVNYDSKAETMEITPSEIKDPHAPYDLVKKMRASIQVLGPLLARCGEARVALPGGCRIGARPVDLHLKGFEAMGATIEIENGYIIATAPQGLKGATIEFPFISVGATEHLMMTACLAKGTTTLINSAREPEIPDLADMLNKMGAKISGAGTSTITIEGVQTMSNTTSHRVVPDRIETGSYAVAAALTGGDVVMTDTNPIYIESFLELMKQAGVTVKTTVDTLTISRSGELKGTDLMTLPYPGIATDLQAQFTTLMTIAQGASLITETVFENRFMHVPELQRMGANITVHAPSSAIVRGVKGLSGAPVSATDLRASFSLIAAGLIAKGETRVDEIHHLDRGYSHLESKLQSLGADVERVEG